MKVGLCFALAGLRAVSVSGANTALPSGRFLQQGSEGTGEPIIIGGGVDDNNNNVTIASIIGGRSVSPGAYPWHATPDTSQTRLLCGAFLIHPDVLATAAHCEGYWAGFDVLIGATSLNGEDAVDVIRGAREYVHPDNLRQDNPFRADADLMLVKLASPSRAPVARLNTRRSVPRDGGRLTAIGFGYYLLDQERVSNELLEVDISAVDNRACEDFINSPPFFPDSMLCAGTAERGTCRGDSGSPIMDEDSGEVVGISSYATTLTCETPAVFTRVSAYDDWIQETICDISDEPPAGCPSSDLCREEQSCDSVFNLLPGSRMHLDINFLGLFPYCLEICAIPALAGFLDLFPGWNCGEC